ncbi:MAG TPA: secretin N-terminal domain-containing protein [Vicinamibacterales bacterium]|nr:secretin N-terminal domain-containing protein [Vicinamibacterales bacterium]
MRRLSTVIVGAVCLFTGGCAASKATHQARLAEQRQDYDVAVVQLTKVVRLHPNDSNARLDLERAKMRAAQDHFARGRRLAATDKLQDALIEYELAAEMNPSSSEIDQELKATRNKLRARVAVVRDGKTDLETLIERTRDLPPPGLDLPQGIKMPASLTFREASSRDVFITIARMANISLIFDSSFREAPLTIDLRNAALEDALNTVANATRMFFRVSAPKTIVVIPDTPAKRREYEEEVVRTFYLSNADLKETMDLLRLVLDARRISPTTATNALTIKDTPEHIAAAARVITAVDKARPEVIIDVELLEVDRTKLLEYGLQIASPTTSGSPSGINGAAAVNAGSNGSVSLQTLKNLSASDILLTNLPTLFYRLLKTDTNTRTLANPQLRTTDGITAVARFGEQVPVPVTTFAPIATGGTPQQPITSYNYQNIGVNIDITPRTHHDDDVSLALKIALTSISGSGFGGLPTFGNREINTTIRLRDGETNMLAGLIRDDERLQFDGIPGLSDVPVIGHLFAHTQKTIDQTDIILTLTPHIIRVLDVNEADLRAFRVGRDSLAPIADLPPAVEPPRAPDPPRPDDPTKKPAPIPR